MACLKSFQQQTPTNVSSLVGGVNSPVRAFKHVDLPPLIISGGEGGVIYDVDGRHYIDFCLGFGTLIHGHGHPVIQQAAKERMEKGVLLGFTSPEEIELADFIRERLSGVDKVRLLGTGTEAVMTAVRLARAFTGKGTIVKFNGHFHGHFDGLMLQAGSGLQDRGMRTSAGTLPEMVDKVVSIPFNDLSRVEEILKNSQDIAAILLEPVMGNSGVILPEEGFLTFLRERTAQRGIVLIFDEVITGFRFHPQGAAGYYRVLPDLYCLGKVMGGGFPIAAVAGREEIMNQLSPQGPVYQAGTYAGHPVSAAAGLAALRLTEEEGFYGRLEEKSQKFWNPIVNAIETLRAPVAANRCGSMMSLFWGVEQVFRQEDLQTVDLTTFRQFFKKMLSQEILLPPSPFEAWFISSAHTTDQLEKAQNAMIQFLTESYG